MLWLPGGEAAACQVAPCSDSPTAPTYPAPPLQSTTQPTPTSPTACCGMRPAQARCCSAAMKTALRRSCLAMRRGTLPGPGELPSLKACYKCGMHALLCLMLRLKASWGWWGCLRAHSRCQGEPGAPQASRPHSIMPSRHPPSCCRWPCQRQGHSGTQPPPAATPSCPWAPHRPSLATIATHMTHTIPVACPVRPRRFGVDPADGISTSYEEVGVNDFGVAVSSTETIESSEAALAFDPLNNETGVSGVSRRAEARRDRVRRRCGVVMSLCSARWRCPLLASSKLLSPVPMPLLQADHRGRRAIHLAAPADRHLGAPSGGGSGGSNRGARLGGGVWHLVLGCQAERVGE